MRSHQRNSYPSNKRIPLEVIRNTKTSKQKQILKKLHNKKARGYELYAY